MLWLVASIIDVTNLQGKERKAHTYTKYSFLYRYDHYQNKQIKSKILNIDNVVSFYRWQNQEQEVPQFTLGHIVIKW